MLGPGTRGAFGRWLPEGGYKSKKTNMFGGATSFQLPTVSPLQASMILKTYWNKESYGLQSSTYQSAVVQKKEKFLMALPSPSLSFRFQP